MYERPYSLKDRKNPLKTLQSHPSSSSSSWPEGLELQQWHLQNQRIEKRLKTSQSFLLNRSNRNRKIKAKTTTLMILFYHGSNLQLLSNLKTTFLTSPEVPLILVLRSLFLYWILEWVHVCIRILWSGGGYFLVMGTK